MPFKTTLILLALTFCAAVTYFGLGKTLTSWVFLYLFTAMFLISLALDLISLYKESTLIEEEDEEEDFHSVKHYFKPDENR
jgi:cobalamin biosynthesis protein CobD/CbiB